MSVSTEPELDLTQSFREATPLLEKLDELLAPLGLQASIVPKAKKAARPKIAAQPQPQEDEAPRRGRRRVHHQVRYWNTVKKIAADENVSIEEARRIYKQRKDAA